MNDERYDLMFSGELVPGFELAQVKKNLQQLFRLDENKINALFSNKPIPLKKGVDADAANKYRVAMKKAGARVDLVLVSESASTPAKPEPPPSRAVGAGVSGGLTTILGAQPMPTKTMRPPIDAPNFGLSAPGAELLSPHERASVEPLDLDISHLTVAPQEGHLLDEDERAILPGIAVTVPDLDVAAVGSDMLKPDERESVVPLTLDLSHLSVAKPGERLGPVSPPAPPPPNVDHLKLKP
jgi:hypothetical protein